MRSVVRAVLTVIVLLTLGAGMIVFASSNWTIALVPIGIVALVCINLEPLVELVIFISRDERDGR